MTLVANMLLRGKSSPTHPLLLSLATNSRFCKQVGGKWTLETYSLYPKTMPNPSAWLFQFSGGQVWVYITPTQLHSAPSNYVCLVLLVQVLGFCFLYTKYLLKEQVDLGHSSSWTFLCVFCWRQCVFLFFGVWGTVFCFTVLNIYYFFRKQWQQWLLFPYLFEAFS